MLNCPDHQKTGVDASDCEVGVAVVCGLRCGYAMGVGQGEEEMKLRKKKERCRFNA